MKLKCLAAGLLLTLMASPVTAHAAGVLVYPAKQVLGFAPELWDKKAPALAAWIRKKSLPALSAEFEAGVRNSFGELAVADIDGSNKHRVLVASLQLVRASQYTVPKKVSSCTEYQLPITLSLTFTNPNTGDVVYSFTDTSYAPVEVHDRESEESCAAFLAQATTSNYQNLLGRLIQEARKGYNPAKVEAALAEVWNGLYILDKGSKYGIARDDNLVDDAGNEIQVSYVTEDYSVAAPLLVSKVVKGATFSKYADKSLVKTLKKPKVLSMHKGWQDEQLETVARFFESELSKESAFTLLPVNESFTALLQSLAQETHIGQAEATNQRAMPDYLIKFTAATPRSYQMTKAGKFGYKIYEQYVLGELLDKQGRILYSAVAGDRIEEKDVDGMVFNKEARLEILLKNAVKELADQFSRSIKFSRFELPVKETRSGFVILEDVAGTLRPGNSVQIYRKLGEVKGIPGEVLVPVWMGEVTAVSGAAATVSLSLPLSSEVGEVKVSDHDVVIIDAVTAAGAQGQETSLTYCRGISPQLGALAIDDFAVLSKGFGYLLPYSLYDDDAAFFAKVADAVKLGGFNSTSLRLGQKRTDGRCLLPVYKSAVEERTCENGDCDATVRVAAGYRLYSGADKKGGAASETRLKIKEASEAVVDQVIQGEAQKTLLGLLKDTVVKVRYQ